MTRIRQKLIKRKEQLIKERYDYSQMINEINKEINSAYRIKDKTAKKIQKIDDRIFVINQKLNG